MATFYQPNRSLFVDLLKECGEVKTEAHALRRRTEDERSTLCYANVVPRIVVRSSWATLDYSYPSIV